MSSLPYVAPFLVFIVAMGLGRFWPFDPAFEYPARVVIAGAVLFALWPGIGWRPARLVASTGVGVVVFVVWIAPDLLMPGWRTRWLFQNSLTGEAGSLDPVLRTDLLFLIFRITGTALLVPVIEELFWRGWLPRYLIKPEFERVTPGTFTPFSFWFTAALFASEHGPYWDVGLLAGIAYNWWMLRTGSLADCMLAHGVTNACLAVYVVGWDQWQYWLKQ